MSMTSILIVLVVLVSPIVLWVVVKGVLSSGALSLDKDIRRLGSYDWFTRDPQERYHIRRDAAEVLSQAANFKARRYAVKCLSRKPNLAVLDDCFDEILAGISDSDPHIAQGCAELLYKCLAHGVETSLGGYISGVGMTSSSAERYLEKIQPTSDIGIKNSTIINSLTRSEKLLKSYLRERPNRDALDPVKAVKSEDKKVPVRDYLSDDEIGRFYSGDRSKAYYDQGYSLSGVGAYAEAEANYRKAIELNPRFAWAYCNLAVLLDEQGRHSEALKHIDEAISLDPQDSDFPKRRSEILENLKPGTPKVDTKVESERLRREATVHFQSGRFKEALNCIEQALPMDEAGLGRDSIVVAAHYKNRGMALVSLQRYKEAIDSYTTALSIFRRVEGASGSQVAICLNDLGCAYLAMDDYPKALDHLQQAVSLDRQLYGNQHPDTARHLANLARAQLSSNNAALREEAKHNLAQARKTLIRIVGPNHPDVRMIEQFEQSNLP